MIDFLSDVLKVLFSIYMAVFLSVFVLIESLFITIGDDLDLTTEQREFAKRWNNHRKHWEAFKIACQWPKILINAMMDGEL
ncbi:hypothetical protein [Nostoc phage A1]|nr:hypothetical protein [Nostoc phage A1]